MRISDWSSDVCSSDLGEWHHERYPSDLDLRARFPAAFHSHVAGHHPSFVVVRLVALSARIRVRPAGPARSTALFDGVDGHRPLSRRNQLSQRDEYMDRHRRPLSAAARDLPPLSPAAAYSLGRDRVDRTAQDAVGQGAPVHIPPRRADDDLRPAGGTGDLRPMAGASWRQTRLMPLKAKLSRPRPGPALFPRHLLPRGSRSKT